MWDDFDEDKDWEGEDRDDLENQKDGIYAHPLAVKAREIVRLTHALVGSLDEARKALYGGMMMEDATLLISKISVTEAFSDYVMKMENAVIIKVHAKSLNSMTYQLAIEQTHAEEHLQLLRISIEEFRVLFKEWVRSFDSSERFDDGWGIFT
jgi:hypothetical protein